MDITTSEWRFKVGPFNIHLTSFIPLVNRHLAEFYSAYPSVSDDDMIDFHINMTQAGGYRRFYKRQACFDFDGYQPFTPLPLSQASGLFEWSLNWCIASNAHQYLIIHAAIIEKNGLGLIMPGSPGSGKSTLCAALVCQGWRLLSDEMALLSIEDGLIYPAPRPVSLKNQSIQIIKQFAPDAMFGNIIADTSKGDIAHMRVPDASVLAQSVPVKPAYLVFPHYEAQSESQLTALAKSRAFMTLAENAFNFNILGSTGFDAMAGLIDQVECYDFSYPDLTTALDGINTIVGR